MSKADVLERIEQERQFWNELVSGLNEADLNRPGAAGDWTFKDVAAHLNAWRNGTVSRLEAAASGAAEPPAYLPTGTEDTDEGVDEINRIFYEQSRDRSAGEILAETQDQFRRMRAAVESLSDDDLSTSGRYSWLPNVSLAEVVDGSIGHMHEEHEPALRAWLAG